MTVNDDLGTIAGVRRMIERLRELEDIFEYSTPTDAERAEMASLRAAPDRETAVTVSAGEVTK
jgi:hypothetical protein